MPAGIFAALLVCVLLAQPVPGLAQEAPDPEELLARAEELIAKSQYTDAAALLVTLEAAPGLTTEQRIRLHLRLSGARRELGEYDAALRAADKAEALARPEGNPRDLARIENARGSIWRFRGYPYRALQYYTKALELAQQAGDAVLLSTAYTNLGYAYQGLQDWSRALYFAERAYEAEPQPTPETRRNFLMQRGIAYYELHERDLAEQSFQDALQLARQAGDRRTVCFALGELGLLYWEFDQDREKALRSDEEAIALARALGVPRLEAAWLLNSGNVFRDTGDVEEALRRYNAALELERRVGQRSVHPPLLKNIGQVLARLGRRPEAEAHLLRAVDEADRANRPRFRWEARMELGQLYRNSDAARADRYFTESLELLEAQHSNVLLENFRAGALSRSLEAYDPYELYIDFLLNRSEVAKAFFVAERARARAFLDTLTAAREQIAASAPRQFMDAEDDLLRRIAERQARLRTEKLDVPARAELVASVRSNEEALTRLRLRLAAEQPALAQARYPRLWRAEELQARVLSGDEALLLFYVGRSDSACWILTKRRLDVVRLPARAALDAAVRTYLTDLRRPEGPDPRQTGSKLSALLLNELSGRVPAGLRLIIVPHGILHYLPFEALPVGDGYLVERHAISYAPSASSHAYLRQLQLPVMAEARRVIVVGDPLTRPAAASDERGFEIAWVGLLKPLPHTRNEVDRIAEIFGSSSDIFVKERATEPALMQASLDRAAIVHFATHAVIDEDHPERSALALSAALPEADGILQMREIYKLRLRGALVTLSACQTALGRDVTGEGIVGLSRAFFYAGASAVMASLWNINDAATARWMASFYERVRAGAPLDEAARDAKLAFLRSGSKVAHPFYWAPFVVSGEASRPVPLAPSQLFSRRAVVLVALCLIAGGLFLPTLRAARRRTSRGPTR